MTGPPTTEDLLYVGGGDSFGLREKCRLLSKMKSEWINFA